MTADPRFTPLFWTVWRRNLRVYRRIWAVNFLPPILEPLFYIVAFGLGFSGLVGDVSWRGQAMTFIQFFAPAMIDFVNIDSGRRHRFGNLAPAVVQRSFTSPTEKAAGAGA